MLVLATDGMPDEPASFSRSLRALQRLPVWLVVRLSTTEPAVVDYWNALDAELELELDVCSGHM